MSGIVVIEGVRYKRAVAERLGLLKDEQPVTRADEPASSGLITSRSAAESVPTGETVVPDEQPTDPEDESAGEDDGSEKGAAEPGSDTTSTPKVTKARSAGSTRKG